MSDPARTADPQNPAGPERTAGPATLIPLPEVAELLAIPITKVHQLLRDGQLVVTTDEAGRRVLPRAFVAGGVVLKGLPSVITLLRDGGYADAEIIEWLLRPDDSLPGTPVQALAENRGTEVKRRAQAAAF
ncbi:Rv2175c family DNA-binding protein [Jatrophihabitans sp.]|uniref:Rv2175c family DNA-binding protein n=1 Tax=Jatrophihabitans sp. TaxID=1932789 RepID=UPI002C6A6E4D|nr:Rv2175c family DNA-binding protein [Jatrophihabitans sp.]